MSTEPSGRPRFDIADIVRRHRHELEVETTLTVAQRRVLSAIALCRTAALGGHVDVCRSCGHDHPAYNSCRNRHCPKCQHLAQEEWIRARAERILPTHHFHVVFTLPSELRALARYRPKPLFDALFGAASATLLELGKSRLDANLGVTMVLHTWTRDLRFHPHVHALVTAGGLRTAGEGWNASSTKYLFPVAVMGELLRGKVMDALRKLYAKDAFEGFADFDDPQGFDRLMQRLARHAWVVYAKKPFRRVDHVLKYLGRYTHRVGIANSRLVNVTVSEVTFRTKAGKTVSLSPVEFLRRFVQHVLPASFVKIRHYGLYASANRATKLEAARELLAGKRPAPLSQNAAAARGEDDDWCEQLRRVTGRDVRTCPVCGGEIARRPVAPAGARASPTRAA